MATGESTCLLTQADLKALGEVLQTEISLSLRQFSVDFFAEHKRVIEDLLLKIKEKIPSEGRPHSLAPLPIARITLTPEWMDGNGTEDGVQNQSLSVPPAPTSASPRRKKHVRPTHFSGNSERPHSIFSGNSEHRYVSETNSEEYVSASIYDTNYSTASPLPSETARAYSEYSSALLQASSPKSASKSPKMESENGIVRGPSAPTIADVVKAAKQRKKPKPGGSGNVRRFNSEKTEANILVERRSTQEIGPRKGSANWFGSFVLTLEPRTIALLKSDPLSFVRDPMFDAFCGIVIVLNAVVVGFETEYLAHDGTSPQSINNMQVGLNIWYLIELLCRMGAFKKDFICGDDRNWNVFDCVLVIVALIDLFSSISIRDISAARILRALRLFRIARTLRIIRTLKYIREFRKMVYSLMSSIQTLFWSLLLVFGVMYSFALLFTQNAAYIRFFDTGDHTKYGAHNIDKLTEYYSSFGRTIYSLFAAISGGYSWHVLLDPWFSCDSVVTIGFFYAYISVSFFGLLNIVTSVFVESAMHATQHFQELLMDAKRRDLEMWSYHMKRIFKEIDTDSGGTISFKEMKVFLQDRQSELPQYLEALGISSSDVWVLFKLLDRDLSGSIDVEEFCDGCMRLKGEAKSFDINCMIYESRAMIHHQSIFMEFVEEQFENLANKLENVILEVDRRIKTQFKRATVVSSPPANTPRDLLTEKSEHLLSKLAPTSISRDLKSVNRGNVII